ncbi:hypothetical protein [Mesorhizobium sp. SP-1A]|uniref:hypothetical protein n=1 Tax=Mesorhizobium sp. SP-1A TaxID=3077840 RepID=UPI0028F6FBE8|nr:hypothetical protein [Mesorhizobium sp. SP-1A]
MNLLFNTNSICAAEAALGRPFVDMIAELESRSGPSLSTLRALLAAGVMAAQYPKMPYAFIDVEQAGRLIDEHGVPAVGAEVGKSLRAYFENKTAGAEMADLVEEVADGN